MYDARLLGTWRSDARRTNRELALRRDIDRGRSRRLAALFGKLELRFTRTRCYSTLNGRTESAPYTVVAKDSSSVALVSRERLTGRLTISHIHFEGMYFWIHVGTGIFREFFKRVESRSTSRPAARRRPAGSSSAVR